MERELTIQDIFKTETMQYEIALYNYALKISGNSDDAKDLVQETYYKAFKNYHQFKTGTNSKAWLFTILKNTFINNYRKRKRTPSDTDIEEIEYLVDSYPTGIHTDMQKELGVYSDLLGDEISSAIGALPQKMREVLLLCDLEGYTYEEIADMVKIPVGTVRSRLHRARKFLHQDLFDYARKNGFLN